MNEIQNRRRALMAMRKEESNILFEWDYTEGLNSKIVSVTSVAPTMASDGLLLQGGSSNYSSCAIAPNIDPLTQSYKATIAYSSLSSPGSDTAVGFSHYNSDAKRTKIYRQNKVPIITRFSNADNTTTLLPWNVADSGTVVIEYDSTNNKIKFTQGQNEYEAVIATPSEWTQQPRIAFAQKGSTSSNASVKIQHIIIERV